MSWIGRLGARLSALKRRAAETFLQPTSVTLLSIPADSDDTQFLKILDRTG